jgi:uncharacterized membrane protein
MAEFEIFFHMKKKYILNFIIFILLLVGSEYIFLNEFSNTQRISILALSAIAVLSSITLIFLTIRRARKDPK